MVARFVRTVKFLRRWSAPEGSHGPLIAQVDPYDDFAYLAVRLRFLHWGAWIRVMARPSARRLRFDHSTFDLRGHPCPCGSGIRIQADVDGCCTEGCLEHMLRKSPTP